MKTSPPGDDLDHGRCCIIITGPPAAGKSTVALLIAQALSRSALLNGDATNRLIVSGRVWALGEPADEAARQVTLCNQNLCQLAANFVDGGFTPVVDWILPDREQLDFYRETLAPRRLLLVVLAPGTEVCRHRNTIRHPDQQFSFDGYESLVASMRDGFGTIGWWFDTSDLSADETAKRITQEAPDRASI